MKKVLILIVVLLIVVITVISFCKLSNQPPKLKDIETVRIEYSSGISEKLSLISPLEITDTEQIRKLVDCFNVKSRYGIGCDCPSKDIIIYFISEKKEYVYNIGITGDPRVKYTNIPDKDIFGIDINDIIDILNKNIGSENLEYPYE